VCQIMKRHGEARAVPLRNQYCLGFTPEKSDTAAYHKLLLKAKQKDTTVQSRDGYYAEQ